jgi:hypothetical protein
MQMQPIVLGVPIYVSCFDLATPQDDVRLQGNQNSHFAIQQKTEHSNITLPKFAEIATKTSRQNGLVAWIL